jgi:hypothetical protein
MKIRVIGQANDGSRHYDPGSSIQVAPGNMDWARGLLASGMAEAEDTEARTFMADPRAVERNRNPAMAEAAAANKAEADAAAAAETPKGKATTKATAAATAVHDAGQAAAKRAGTGKRK